jgi:Tol biopolymer transport system component
MSLQADSYQAICDIPAMFLTGALVGSNLLLSARTGNFLVAPAGGKPQPSKQFMPWPQLLPDGRHVLFTSPDFERGHHRARVMEFNRPETTRDLLETDSRAVYTPSLKEGAHGYLIYVKSGNLLAQPFDPESLSIRGEPLPIASQIYSFFQTGAADFSASNNGILAYRRYMSRSQLAWVNRKGDVLSTIGPENVNVKQGRLSTDGTKIATAIFDVNRGVNALWIVDTKTGAARRAVSERGQMDNAVWSPDSNRLVFNYANASPPKLFLRGLGEHDAMEPLPEGFFQVPNDWSADGRFLAFTNSGFAPSQNEMQGDVWLVDMARNRRVLHLIQTPFHEANPAFSPDGRWLAFMSNESGRAEVYVQSFVAGEEPRLVGERILLSRRGAAALRWRRDGRELFYLGADGRVYSVPVTLGAKVRVGEEAPLFTVSTEARAAIHGLSGFDVSPDGEQFLIPIVKSAERSEIVVMQNWESEQGRPGGLPH